MFEYTVTLTTSNDEIITQVSARNESDAVRGACEREDVAPIDLVWSEVALGWD